MKKLVCFTFILFYYISGYCQFDIGRSRSSILQENQDKCNLIQNETSMLTYSCSEDIYHTYFFEDGKCVYFEMSQPISMLTRHLDFMDRRHLNEREVHKLDYNTLAEYDKSEVEYKVITAYDFFTLNGNRIEKTIRAIVMVPYDNPMTLKISYTLI